MHGRLSKFSLTMTAKTLKFVSLAEIEVQHFPEGEENQNTKEKKKSVALVKAFLRLRTKIDIGRFATSPNIKGKTLISLRGSIKNRLPNCAG